MKHLTRIAVLAALVVMSGCYHARVNTGLTPSATVIEKPFAAGWLYGLIPPSPINAAEECPNGVAIVETELSLVNQVVSAITFGIFAPMHIKVTCATGSGASIDAEGARSLTVGSDRTEADVIATFSEAADIAVKEHAPVLVRFE